jgi:GT2 family glycosyltransferase
MEHGGDLVSVIVPSLGRESLRPLLERLARQGTTRPFEVVLVPQGPLPPDLPLGPRVRVVPAPPGLGFAAYRNVGIGAARGDPVCFVDDDALPREDWLDRITAGVGPDRHAAATADLRVPLGRGPLADAISLLGFPGGAAAGWQTMWPVTEDGTTRHLCTGNCAISREALDATGGFDAGLVDGSEDVDLGDRIVASGRTIRYAEDAAVEHEARTGLAAFWRWHLRRGRSGGDLARRKPIGGHVRGRLASSWRILRRTLPTRHGPAVAGLLLVQYLAQGLGYLRARYGHRST